MCSSSLNFLDCTLDMFLLYCEKSINKDTQLSLKCTKILFQNRNSVTTVSGFWFCVFCRDFTGHMLKTVIEKNRASNTSQLNGANIPIQAGLVILGRLHKHLCLAFVICKLKMTLSLSLTMNAT